MASIRRDGEKSHRAPHPGAHQPLEKCTPGAFRSAQPQCDGARARRRNRIARKRQALRAGARSWENRKRPSENGGN